MTDAVAAGGPAELFPDGQWRDWYTARDLAGLPGVPGTKRRVHEMARREGWEFREVEENGGTRREYAWASLPEATQKEICRQLAVWDLAPTEKVVVAPGSVPYTHLPEHQRRRVEARLEVLGLLDQFRARTGLGQTRAERVFAPLYNAGEIDVDPDVRAYVPTASWNSLARWRRYRSEGRLDRLGSWHRGNDKGGRISANPHLEGMIISRLEAHQHVTTSQVLVWLRARGVPETALPGERRLRDWISKYRAENAMRLAMIHDPDGARSRYQPAFGKAGASVERLNQLWELDATPADVMLTDGRHTVVGVIDVLTRRFRVLVVPSSKATAVVALIRRATIEWGVPEAVKTDNGKDFTARHVAGALKALEIEHRLCPPFTPEAKPHIERALGTLMHDLVEQLPGYIGHNVADRQAIRSRESFARRFGTGGDDTGTFQVGLTADEFQRTCDTWCQSLYERRPHAGLDGQTPHVMAVKHAHERRVIADEAALDVVLLPPAAGDGWRAVGKHGLKVQGGTYVAPELATVMGQRVRVHIDPTDAGRVCVYDAEGKFLCWAVAPEREGIDLAALAARTRQVHRSIDRETRSEARRRKRDYRPDDAWRDVIQGAGQEPEPVVAVPGQATEHAPGALDEAATAGTPKRVEKLTDEQLAEAQARVSAMNGAALERERAQLAEEERLRALASDMVMKAEQRRGA